MRSGRGVREGGPGGLRNPEFLENPKKTALFRTHANLGRRSYRVFFRVCGKNPLGISAFDAFGLDMPGTFLAVLGVPGQKSGVPGVPATFLADSNSFSHQNAKTCVWRLFRRPLEGFPEGFNTKLCLGRVPEGVREAVWASGGPKRPF